MIPKERSLDERGERLLKRILRQAFRQRRKKLKNTLKAFKIPEEFMDRRPEELNLEDFVRIVEMNL